ncbi:MAG: TonB-dependent receptor [Lacunisphaera sp.]|nr:TonB-dependent receptor [Lacunisphaera sp.]
MNPLVTPSASHPRLVPHGLMALCLLLPVTSLLAQSAAPVKSLEEEATATTSDKVIQLDTFKVSAAIDTYHQATSSMATKLPMELKEIPSSLSIMNATAITDRNAVTLVDVFGYVVGATQSQGNINGFSFRGFPNTGSYTQNIQFDGLMGATLKKAASSAANVDSLEFLKGPNGVLYGQMNPGGLLNIVTKNPKEKRESYLRLTAGVYAGEFTSFGSKVTNTLSYDTTGPVPGIKHLFYRLVADAGSTPSSRPGNWDRNYSVYPSLSYRWSTDTSFTIKMESSQDVRRQDDGVIPIFTSAPISITQAGVVTTSAAFGENAAYFTAPLNTVYNDHKDTARDFGQAISTVFHTTLGSEWQVRVQSRSVWHRDIVREFTVNNANVFSPTAKNATPTSLLRRQYNNVDNGHRYNYIDANVFRAFETGKVKQTIIAGIGGGKEFFGNKRIAFGPNQTLAQAVTLINPILDLVVDYPVDGTGATDQATDQTALGEYVSDQIKVGDRVHVSLGVRHDHQLVEGLDKLKPATTTFSNTLDAYTKQGGVVLDVTSQISTYGSFSQSIKPQTNIAFDVNGNSSFPAESGEQYELGLKFETPQKNLNIAVAAYQIKRTNVVVASGTNFTVATGSAQVGQAISRLDGEQTSKGYELEVQYQPLPHWQLQGGFASSKATITGSTKNPESVGFDLANAPRLTGNFWTRYNFPTGALKGLGVGTGIVYVGKAWAGDPTTSVYYRLKGWTRVDSSIYYKWKRYDFALNIQNLLDKRYISSAQSALTLNIGEQRKLTFSAGLRF